MNLIEVTKNFNTQNKCIKHLEKVRWGSKPVCVHCRSKNVSPRKNRKHYYHCNKCKRDFTVLYGTIFESSKLPLPEWFAVITLMLNARKGISAMNIMRDVGITYKTAWYTAMRVRCAMLDQPTMLEGIVEMDEAYIGGKPRKRNIPDHFANLGYVETDDWKKDKWRYDKRVFNRAGNGKNKVKVVGIVERGKDKGRVALKVQDRLSGADMLRMLKRYVNINDATVMTDDFKAYKAFDKVLHHYTVNHSNKEYVRHLESIKDSIHTNTIEGVWSIIKNGIRGQYHVLSKKYLPFYLAEAAYKYNRRSKSEKNKAFTETIDNAVTDKKPVVNYKPKGDVRKIVYGEIIRKKRTKKPKHKPPTRPSKLNKRGKLTKKQWKKRMQHLRSKQRKLARQRGEVVIVKKGRPKSKTKKKPR